MKAQPAPLPSDAPPPLCRRDAATQRLCPRCVGTGTITEIDPAALVMAIADEVGDRAFTVRELVAHAEIDAALARALGDISARRIGKALRKIVGWDFDGQTIERLGADGQGAIWRVKGVVHSNRGPF
jgi:hypothetical protein